MRNNTPDDAIAAHTDGENAEYWATQAEGWIQENVHGKQVDDVISIAGDAVIILGDGWDESDAKALRDGLIDYEFEIQSVRGSSQVRIEATDRRLKMPYTNE